jgi:AcrR family transcriptional regulator
MASIELSGGEQNLDPRIRRTRQMLRNALFGLLQEKTFETISIQDIAERSTVNRATFYDHYRDKSELVQDLVLQRFNDLLCQRQVHYDGTCLKAGQALILAVCDFLLQLSGGCPKHERLFEPFVQTTIQRRLQQILWEGFQKHPPATNVDPCLTATTMSWAIYGAATHWLHSENRPQPEQFAEAAFKLIQPILIGNP